MSQKFESPKASKQLSTHRFKCSCAPSSEPYACASAFQWLLHANKMAPFDFQKNRRVYLNLLGVENNISGSELQIEKDITRTFPQQAIFQQRAGEGQQSLSRVLLAFSKYDNTIGYVQGMNFIVGSLLMHCSEEVTFWLFVALIEDYEMRDIYMPGLPGLYKHIAILEHLMERHLPALYAHFGEQSVQVEMYASNWIFSLYSNVVPTAQMNTFFDNFYLHGWAFFYRFTLTLLRILQPKVLELDDLSEIIDMVKTPMQQKNFHRDDPGDRGAENFS